MWYPPIFLDHLGFSLHHHKSRLRWHIGRQMVQGWDRSPQSPALAFSSPLGSPAAHLTSITRHQLFSSPGLRRDTCVTEVSPKYCSLSSAANELKPWIPALVTCGGPGWQTSQPLMQTRSDHPGPELWGACSSSCFLSSYICLPKCLGRVCPFPTFSFLLLTWKVDASPSLSLSLLDEIPFLFSWYQEVPISSLSLRQVSWIHHSFSS